MDATTTKAKPLPAPKTERRAQKAEASETAARAAQSAKTQSAKTARSPPEVVASSGSYSYTYSDESGEEEGTSKQAPKMVPAVKKQPPKLLTDLQRKLQALKETKWKGNFAKNARRNQCLNDANSYCGTREIRKGEATAARLPFAGTTVMSR